MRRPLLLALALSALGCHSAAIVARTPRAGGDGPPAWLPPYSEEQLALLEPAHEPVLVPALPTYPDPGQFRYARDRVLEDPREAMRSTKIVADIVSESPRMYTVTEAGPSVENAVAQYGPPPSADPDASLVATRDVAGRVKLLPAKASNGAKIALALGMKSQAEGKRDAAIGAFRDAVGQAPDHPAIQLALARSLADAGQHTEAEAAFRDVIRIDPTLASGHEGLAGALLAQGDAFGARISVAHALAYHPHHQRAVALARRLAPDAPQRAAPFSIFLEVDRTGVVRVATGPGVGARMYAGCRAVMRYEPEVRVALFEVSPDAPYFLSAAEEMFCIESAIGAFVAERAVARDEGRPPASDVQTGALMALAHSEGLLGFVMYETLGKYRPEHARTAPSSVHRAMMEYVQRHVLAYDPGPDLRHQVAQR